MISSVPCASSYPDKITLLRGNHESREITRIYGFYYEITHKYESPDPWVWCTEVFDYLGVAAVGALSALHSSSWTTASSACTADSRPRSAPSTRYPIARPDQQIRTISRTEEIPSSGPFSDLLWSDPDNVDGFHESPRGAGYVFGESPVNHFTETNGLELICRAHQMVQQGFQYMFSRSNLVTVWSAPNYCYRCENVACVLMLDASLNRTFKVFKEVGTGRRLTDRTRMNRKGRVDLEAFRSLVFSEILVWCLFLHSFATTQTVTTR